MSDKVTRLREADEEFTGLRRAIGGLTDEQMRQVWLGTWGVREIVIHISGWHEVMIPALGRAAKGEAPYPAGTYDDFDSWNARFVEQRTGVKTADVLAELDDSYRRFVAAAAAVPEQHFAPGGTAREPFDGAGPGHYREHAAQIREWRQTSPGGR
jgi:Mycothiol maleylpyruvate isomerase N-terminal domain